MASGQMLRKSGSRIESSRACGASVQTENLANKQEKNFNVNKEKKILKNKCQKVCF
jgi:hypothetical protein